MIGKRLLDIIVSAVGLLLFGPVMAVIALLIRLDSPGAALFKQERIGKDGEIFTIHKFRTMVVNAPDGAVTDDAADPRVTRIGAFLRHWSLDELPQLFDVLRGKMSIVGPRPDRTFRLPDYTQKQRERLRVKPGITGLAQIHGRNQIPWEERYEWDRQYVENRSLGLDFAILLKTLKVVLKREGVNYSGVSGSDTAANRSEHLGKK